MSDTPQEWNRLCNVEELAAALGRSRTYVSGMKRAGFTMPGGTATVNEARKWLRENPEYNSKTVWGHPKKRQIRPPRVRSV